MVSFMLFIFLCFFGILAVLFYMLRSQEKLCQSLRDEHAQLRVLLRALESRLDALCAARGEQASPAHAVELSARPSPAEDPLLRLSFDPPDQPSVGHATRDGQGVDPALDLHFDPEDDVPRR